MEGAVAVDGLADFATVIERRYYFEFAAVFTG
jgi:hypothetical protein